MTKCLKKCSRFTGNAMVMNCKTWGLVRIYAMAASVGRGEWRWVYTVRIIRYRLRNAIFSPLTEPISDFIAFVLITGIPR